MVNKDNATPEKLQEKITAMREGGKILGNLLRDLKNYVKPGMTGKEIDAWVRKEIVARGAEVAYDMLDEEFPGAICISINDELVHGAPKDEPLEVGDKVSFDLDIYYKGYFTDSAFTMLVGGEGSPAVKKMISVTEASMWEGIEQVKPGVAIGTIGHAVEQVLRKGHLGVIENYVGHGIDKEMHD
ncbi:M24 family metallopeptidase, partial [Candidatus Saccharibacteria bacterium]|nr:M24 family metallopeptidase [Candidatus Saccharibacteria bacterium]